MTSKVALAAASFLVLGLLLYRFTGGPGPIALKPLKDDRPDALASVQPERPVVLHEVAATPDRTAESQPAPQQVRARSDGSSDWAVIAATYKNHGAAASRARALRSQFADCACAVYPLEGAGERYYVIVAQGVQQDAAEQVRERAVQAGLPPDTYVTRLIRSE